MASVRDNSDTDAIFFMSKYFEGKLNKDNPPRLSPGRAPALLINDNVSGAPHLHLAP
ncbi:MAG: hypothetical protein ACK5HT_07880 [Draconibacterium sp.]